MKKAMSQGFTVDKAVQEIAVVYAASAIRFAKDGQKRGQTPLSGKSEDNLTASAAWRAKSAL